MELAIKSKISVVEGTGASSFVWVVEEINPDFLEKLRQVTNIHFLSDGITVSAGDPSICGSGCCIIIGRGRSTYERSYRHFDTATRRARKLARAFDKINRRWKNGNLFVTSKTDIVTPQRAENARVQSAINVAMAHVEEEAIRMNRAMAQAAEEAARIGRAMTQAAAEQERAYSALVGYTANEHIPW